MSLDGRTAKVEKINEVTSEETPRVATNLKELNRVLGGCGTGLYGAHWW